MCVKAIPGGGKRGRVQAVDGRERLCRKRDIAIFRVSSI